MRCKRRLFARAFAGAELVVGDERVDAAEKHVHIIRLRQQCGDDVLPRGKFEREVDRNSGLLEFARAEIAGGRERNFDDEPFGTNRKKSFSVRNGRLDIVRKIGVQFDADVRVEFLDEAQAVPRVEDEREFELHRFFVSVRRGLADNIGGARNKAVVNSFLNFFVQQRVVRRQRGERRIPERGRLGDVARVEPELRSERGHLRPLRIGRGLDFRFSEFVFQTSANERVNGIGKVVHVFFPVWFFCVLIVESESRRRHFSLVEDVVASRLIAHRGKSEHVRMIVVERTGGRRRKPFARDGKFQILKVHSGFKASSTER